MPENLAPLGLGCFWAAAGSEGRTQFTPDLHKDPVHEEAGWLQPAQTAADHGEMPQIPLIWQHLWMAKDPSKGFCTVGAELWTAAAAVMTSDPFLGLLLTSRVLGSKFATPDCANFLSLLLRKLGWDVLPRHKTKAERHGLIHSLPNLHLSPYWTASSNPPTGPDNLCPETICHNSNWPGQTHAQSIPTAFVWIFLCLC